MTKHHHEAGRDKAPARSYDYVIAGAGSAGCVVARRLMDSTDATVLLLEAGGPGEGGASLSNPPQWVENLGSRYDWARTATSRARTSLAAPSPCHWARS